MYIYIIYIYILYVCACGGQRTAIRSFTLFLPCGSQGLNSDHQAWWFTHSDNLLTLLRESIG